jgi:hypothetical protein
MKPVPLANELAAFIGARLDEKTAMPRGERDASCRADDDFGSGRVSEHDDGS